MTQPNNSSRLLGLSLAACLALIPDAKSQVLEEIVVTAQKRAETLQSVPIAISALGNSELAMRNVKGFEGYITTVPGASFFDTGGLTGSELKFRGVGNGTAQLSPTTAVYLGEVPVIHTGRNVNSSYNFRTIDLERVEVLRGPQGQLYGSNSLGGAIKNIPNKPLMGEFTAEGSLGYSDTRHGDESYDADITLNFPLHENRLAARLTAYRAVEGGWYDNIYAGGIRLSNTIAPPPFTAAIPLPGGTLPAQTQIWAGQPFNSPLVPGPPGIIAREPGAAGYIAPPNKDENVNETDAEGLRLMLRWTPDDMLTADLMLAWEESEMDAGAFASETRGEPSMFGPPGSFDTSVLPGNMPNTVLYLTDAKEYEHANPVDAGKEDGIKLANLVLEYESSLGTLTSSTSWWERDERLAVDISLLSVLIGSAGNTVPLFNERRDNPSTFIQEIRLASRQDQSLRWLGGLFYQDIDQNFELSLQDQSGLDLLYLKQVVQNEALFLPPPDSRIPAAQDSSYQDETWAAFGELAYDFNESLTASFSFRYFELDQEFKTVGTGFQFVGAGASQGSTSQNEFTPRMNLTWTPADDRMVYASASKGFRTGIINRQLPPVNCGLELQNAGWADGVPPTEPDTTWNYEIGTKLEWKERVRLNVAMYHIDWEDIQTAVFMPAFNPVPAFSQCTADVVANVGSASINGVEVELTAYLTDSLRVNWAASYLQGEYDEDLPQANIEQGDTIENQPDLSSFLSLNWDFELMQKASYARLEWQHVGDIEAKATDFVTQKQPFDIGDYDLLHVRLGMDVNEHVAIDLYAENITDEFAVTQTLDTGGISAPVIATVRPRNIGIRFHWQL
tara:strand:+ start:53487 stop:56021 length:2535 start_codon:yes stop_codon:yes gene_type:complete